MQAVESISEKGHFSDPEKALLRAENAQLKQQLQQLQLQLDWFKRQLFGQKSEKRLELDNPVQGSLFDAPAAPVPVDQPTQQIAYKRRVNKQRGEDCVTDQGLRFDASVPVEVIEVSAPELDGPEADQYEVIDYKITRRLAQRPGSHVVLEYRRPVLKHRPSQRLISTPAPAAVFEGSLADVSFLAGLLVDKFCYHLPLYRQHKRLLDAGITLSRSTLIYLARRTIDLLIPIADAQLQNALLSRVLAMDDKFAWSEFGPLAGPAGVNPREGVNKPHQGRSKTERQTPSRLSLGAVRRGPGAVLCLCR
jgi:transposase